MTRPLLTMKMFVPRARPGLVVRPRLLERLSSDGAAKLTLVSAPPGFGKTTLLAEWARTATSVSGRVAWLSLEQGDNDPGSFWPYVVASLEAVVPSVSAACRELAVAEQGPGRQLIATLLNELAGVTGEVWLVLDDYHLIDNHDIQDGVRFLLEHLPPQVH
ncbi:MAG TPA: helix-turn-helix transcriptional regulator, partial [Arachnia sp.]|nr:helix-turn-helix transcriptional regulator [Arachnia sp.]